MPVATDDHESRRADRWNELIAIELKPLRLLRSAPWPLIAAAAVTLWVPLKMVRVAHGDHTTALAVLAASDKATVVAGMLVLLLPYVVLVAWTICCLVFATALGRIQAAADGKPHATEASARRSLLRLVIVSIPAALLGWLIAAAVPWPAAVVAAVAVCATSAWSFWGQGRVPRETPLPQWLARHPVRLALVAAACTGLLTLLVVDLVLSRPLDDRMWLPAQILETRDGPVVGYVLKHDQAIRTVLLDSPRAVVAVPDAHITGTGLCDVNGSLDERSLWDLMRAREGSLAKSCPR
jgi:phosphatidylglycerophosphate synthase